MLLSLTMIVRDEEEQLPDCLASVKDAVDEIIVVDTGSRDRTPDIVQAFGGTLLQIPWQGDFSAARNVALGAAHGKWALVMDADERFEGDPAQVRRLLKATRAIGFEVPIRNELEHGRVDQHSTLRLFRRLPGVRFERRLHEQVLPSLIAASKGRRIGTAPFTLRHLGYTEQQVARKNKRERNLDLAKAEVASNPFDPFAAFNLGVEYTASGDLAQGVSEFRRARAITGKPQDWQSRLYKVEAQSLYSLGRYEEVLDVLKEGLPVFPDFTDLHFLRGVALEALGDVREAEATLRHCLRLGPAKTPPYDGVDPLLGGAAASTALGSLLRRQGQYDEALSLLRAAAADTPGWMPAVQALVECILVSGGGLTELLAQRPPDTLEVAAALFRSARYDLAVQVFAAAEKEHEMLPADHHLVMAIAFLRLGDVDGAAAAVAAVGDRIRQSARSYVVDLVLYAKGELERAALAQRYPASHPIWREIAAAEETHPS
jgi:tetratricopeptide (TPR) repeat protein